MRTTSLAVATAVLAWVLAPAPAVAHAALTGSDPEQGQQLTTLPASVTVEMNETVSEPAFVAVTGPGREQVEQTGLTVDDKTVTADLENGDAPAGEYTLAYRLVSVDGHAVTGEIDFAVERSAAAAPAESPSIAPTPAPSGAEEGVRLTSVPESGDDQLAPYIVLGFFFVALGLLVLLIRAGMRLGDAEDT